MIRIHQIGAWPVTERSGCGHYGGIDLGNRRPPATEGGGAFAGEIRNIANQEPELSSTLLSISKSYICCSISWGGPTPLVLDSPRSSDLILRRFPRPGSPPYGANTPSVRIQTTVTWPLPNCDIGHSLMRSPSQASRPSQLSISWWHSWIIMTMIGVSLVTFVPSLVR